jgi:antitoxin ParD1/3/4
MIKYDNEDAAAKPALERLTVTVPAEMAAHVKRAVDGGEYASTSEVIRDALRDWQVKSEIRRRKLESLRRAIEEGVADLEAGRLVTPNIDAIMEQGKKLSRRSGSSG